MNKHEMIGELAIRCGLSQKDTKELLDASFSCLSEILIQNEMITIPDFGTFENHLRPKHRFFDFFRKKIMIAPQKLHVIFHPASKFKDEIRGMTE